MIIFIAVAALLRGRLRFVLAFGALLALCLVGEMADFSYAVRRGIAFNWLASAKDVVNTMFWPAIGLVAGPQILRILRPIRESRVAAVPPRMPDSARSAP